MIPYTDHYVPKFQRKRHISNTKTSSYNQIKIRMIPQLSGVAILYVKVIQNFCNILLRASLQRFNHVSEAVQAVKSTCCS